MFEAQISKEDYASIQEKMYKYKGFYFRLRTIRKYIKPIAAHVFGYIGEVNQSIIDKDNDKYYKAGDYVGIAGIEKQYEQELRGSKGLKILMADALNRDKGSYKNGEYDIAPVSGSNLYSGLDYALQEYGEKLMENKRGSVVAIDPSTGEILALISVPSYDPNLLVGRTRTKNYKLLQDDPNKPLFNRALKAKYPPGSTFKLINALIGLQERAITFSTTYPCSRGFHYGGLNVGCHEHNSPLDLEGSIIHSCNAYYCKAFGAILNKYKTDRDGYIVWRNYVTKFGFGNKFNSDIPNHSSGFVPKAEYYDKRYGKNGWKWLTVISLAIGQGELGITPLQLANMSAIIANRGYYITPHLIKKIGNKVPNKEYLVKHYTGISKIYFDKVADAMYNVVEGGTGMGGKINGISVCGKTGTAQNPHGKDHSIFVAFAPKDNPKISISVFVENAGFGATWAVPIASLMIEKYLNDTVLRKDLEDRMFKPIP